MQTISIWKSLKYVVWKRVKRSLFVEDWKTNTLTTEARLILYGKAMH